MSALDRLTDSRLLAELARVARNERQATAEVVAHIAEVDARRLYLGDGFPSMFAYCTEVLKMSEPAAGKRIRAARKARLFPVILDMLRSGELHLSGILLLAPHLTSSNHQELLSAASNQSKRQIETLIVSRFPCPDVPATVRKQPARSVTPSDRADTTPQAEHADAAPPANCTAAGGEQAFRLRPPSRPAEVSPLAADRFKVQFTADQELHDLLREAQDLMRHTVPRGDVDEVVRRGLKLLVEDLKKRKLGARRGGGKRKKSIPRGEGRSRHIPNSVKRLVVERDGMRCSFVSAGGRRCSATGFLEFHHRDPYARGGEHSPANVAIVCRSHNQHTADLDFGRDFMECHRRGDTGHADSGP